MTRTTREQRPQVFIDRGGTFTDCIGVDAQGRVHVTKVLSSDSAPLIGIRALFGIANRCRDSSV